MSKVTWTLSDQGSAIVVGSGMVFFKNKKPQGINYETLLNLINANPNTDLYHIKAKRRLTLGKAIDMNMLDKVGDEMIFTTTINVHTIVHDRQFDDLPDSGKDLITKIYNSKPLEVDER